MAPPDSALLEEPLLALSAEAAADSVGVAVADADVGDADEDVDVDVDVGVADVDDVERTVVDWSSLIISRSSFTSKAAKSLLALFLHAPHEYPALESHLVSRYIEIQRLLPSGSQENGLSLPRGEFVQFCDSWPRAISVSSVALV
jgi:hypothetical protein